MLIISLKKDEELLWCKIFRQEMTVSLCIMGLKMLANDLINFE